MAFRLTEASSSLWPPDRKQMPERQEAKYLDLEKKSTKTKYSFLFSWE